jgi:hypothetical protein
MTAAATPPEDAPAWARPLFERQIAMAGELAEAGLAMALDAKDQALAPADGEVEPAMFESLSRAFVRLARSTRLSLMLQDRLIKDLIAFDRGGDAKRDDRRHGVDRIVRVIVDPQHDTEGGERLVKEGAERLDRECLEDYSLSRPVSEARATQGAPGVEVGCSGRPHALNSSPIGGGGPDEALARSGGGGLPEAEAPGSIPVLHAAYPRRATSPDGGGLGSGPAP